MMISKRPIPPTEADLFVATLAASKTNPTRQNFLRTATWAADGHVLGPVAAAFWLASRKSGQRHRTTANHLALTLAAAIAVPKVIKNFIDRRRPDRSVVGSDRQGVTTSGRPYDSFPSGHSVHIGAVDGALAWAYPDKSRYIYAACVALAATRVAVLAHWPTDVLAGWALGAAIERSARQIAD
jgi:membrane-associated phospholipid phosphatase